MQKVSRLYFIDAIRAFAIIMMLQGHFIDDLLHPIYNNDNHLALKIWRYLRGLTAPTFFTISGLIFTYLLLKAFAKQRDNVRIKKGVLRGIVLILIGYALRMDVLSWLNGNFKTHFLEVDVLHCIGLSLLILVGLHLLLRRFCLVYALVLLVIACACFLTEPLYRNMTFNTMPVAIANYVSKANGSVFTILPWFGYVAFGGCIATFFFNFEYHKRFKLYAITAFLIFGFTLLKFSSYAFSTLYNITGTDLFFENARYNYLFSRLGNVLIVFGICYSIERYLKFSMITKIGQNTLSIYVIHAIILYGSFTNLGLKQYFEKALNPTEAFIGVLCFTVLVCFISFYVSSNAFIYAKIEQLTTKIKRIIKQNS
jgi:uncharacterized membrane protein